MAVQSNKAGGVNVTSLTVQYASNVVQNNRSITGAVCSNAQTISSVTDNGVNSYNADVANVTDATVGGTSDVRSANISNGGGTRITVTVNFSASTSPEIYIAEESGISTAANAVDVSGSNIHNAGTTVTHTATTSVASAAANEVVIYLDNASTTNNAGPSGNNGTTVLQDDEATSGSAWGDKLATGGVTETAGVTVSPTADLFIGIIVVYKLAAAAAASIILPNPRRRRNILPTAHSRQMVPAPITVAPPPLVYIPSRGSRRFFLASRRVRLALPLATADLLPQPVRRRQQLPSIRRRPSALTVLDQVLVAIARRRASVARVIRRRAEFPWFQATVPPPPIWIPEGRKNRALRFWRRRWIRNEFPWFQALLPVTGPKLPPAIASSVQAAIASPRSAPMATPGQAPVAQPRSGAIATPVQTPKIIN